jgi:hypothetical protein
MPQEELALMVALAAVNLGAGFGLAVPLGRRECALTGRLGRQRRCVVVLLAVYFAECVAFAAGMATQVFTLGLAPVWGIVFGLRLRGVQPTSAALRQVFLVGLYGSIPSASFGVLILLSKWLAGADVTSTAAGLAFGIPTFVPWPLNTILGFSAALAIGTVVLKTTLTVAVAGFVLRMRGERADDSRSDGTLGRPDTRRR